MKKVNEKNKGNLMILGGILILVIILIVLIVTSNNEDMTTNKIALIPIKGAISLYESKGLFSSGGTSTETTIEKINKAEEDPLVKAIILEINSGGGTVVASKELAAAVKKADKPIIAWIREIGTSGAYWVASASDRIVADETSMTGSVGVRGSYLEFSELFEKYGINYQQITSGKYKDIGSPYKNMTTEEYNVLMGKIEIITQIFLEDVRKNRNLDQEAVDELATAELFLGVEAKELGLVDILGSKEEAIKTAEDLANISSSRIVTYVQEKTLFEKLAGMLLEPSYFIGKGIGDSLISLENNEVLLAK